MEKLALVTGASRGLGREIAKILAQQGHHVIGAARSVGPLQELAKETKGSYFSFDGYDLNSVRELANHTFEKSKEYLDLKIIIAADNHEDATVGEGADKRYTTLEDFDDDFIRKSKLLAVEGPLEIYKFFKERTLNFNFFYISSQAAKEEFWDKGNGIYGPNKKAVEEALSNYLNATSIRFPFIDTDMADKLLHQLAYVEPFVHVGGKPGDTYEDLLKKPLKKKKDLFLPLNHVAKDTAAFTLGNKENFGVVSPGVWEYTKTVEDFKN